MDTKLTITGDRGTGKTSILADIARKHASIYPESTILILAPTFSHLEVIMDKVMVDEGIEKVIHKPNLEIRYKNGSRVFFRRAGKNDQLGVHGFRPHTLIIDEVAHIDKEIYEEIIPTLSAKHVIETRVTDDEDRGILERRCNP